MYSEKITLTCTENKTTTITFDPRPGVIFEVIPPSSACEQCPNNPKNGGSGSCHCTLGLPKVTC